MCERQYNLKPWTTYIRQLLQPSLPMMLLSTSHRSSPSTYAVDCVDKELIIIYIAIITRQAINGNDRHRSQLPVVT